VLGKGIPGRFKKKIIINKPCYVYAFISPNPREKSIMYAKEKKNSPAHITFF